MKCPVPSLLCVCFGDVFGPGTCDNIFLLFRVAQKREDAVSKEVTRKLSEADNRKMSRKEKDERLDSYGACGHRKRNALGKPSFYFGI